MSGLIPMSSGKKTKRLQKSRLRLSGSIIGNAGKFLNYTEAWARIRLAIKQGFFLEAVAIQESIISDRLISYLVKSCGQDPSHKGLRKLNDTLGMWGRAAKGRAVDEPDRLRELEELQDRLDRWRDERNEVIHGLVGGRSIDVSEGVEDFLGRAKHAAQEGEILARLVNSWVRRERTRLSSPIPQSGQSLAT
jgi:hypothetical protein